MSSPDQVYRRVLAAIDAVPARGATKFVAIDGRGGAGKTRLALELMARAPGMRCLPVDHFPCTREEYPLHPTGIQTRISVARLLMTLLPLAEGERAQYRRTSWSGEYRSEAPVVIDAGDTLLIEGCYTLLPQIRPLLDFAIWIECPSGRALERALNRDDLDAAGRTAWREGHGPAQERYIQAHTPSRFASLVLAARSDGTLEIVPESESPLTR